MHTRDQDQAGPDRPSQDEAPKATQKESQTETLVADKPHRLRIDARGRVLLPPPLRAATGLLPNQPLLVVLQDDELHVSLAGAEKPEGNIRLPTLDLKGRLTLPGPLRGTLGLVPGGTVLMQPMPPGMRLVTPARLLGRLREARESLTRHLEGS
jgi:bifunctional DNA-binding transcriptional regulator/antitoxin component of YhaV-PrlF toxin-antitoxin module